MDSQSDKLCSTVSMMTFIKQFTNLETVMLGRLACGQAHNRGQHYAVSDELFTLAESSTYRNFSRARTTEINRLLAEGASISNSRLPPRLTVLNDEFKDYPPLPTGCPQLKRFSCDDSLNSAEELRTLSEIAPNITELSAPGYYTHFLVEGSPSVSMVPALRVWSHSLVKLILPDCDNWLDRYTRKPHASVRSPNYSEDGAVADVITQMPSLRVLGISRAFIAPRHFLRGPETLVSLNYYLPERFLDAFVAVLDQPSCLPHLRQLCLSIGELRYTSGTAKINGVLDTRGIYFHRDGADWRDAAGKLNV